jgi:hypothetical protein
VWVLIFFWGAFFGICSRFPCFNIKVLILLAGNDCANCVDDSLGSAALNRWTMPLLKLGEKRYYLGIFFKVYTNQKINDINYNSKLI